MQFCESTAQVTVVVAPAQIVPVAVQVESTLHVQVAEPPAVVHV
jgi:hypothetical protein